MSDVGFVTGPIGGYGEPQPTGVDEIPSTVTESMDWFQATRMLGRASQRGQMEQDLSLIPEAPAAGGGFLDTPGNLGPGFGGQGDPGQDKTFGTPAEIQQRQADTMSKDEANLRYGVDGELTFDGPTLKGVAQNLYEAKLDELRRRSIAERAPPGFFNSLTRFGANFVANFLDPLNVAASFIPVVGEARYAEWLASAGTAAGRAGVRAGVGAAAGAVGNVPVVGLEYALSKSEQADYSAVQALTDLATGALIGGVLHVGGGFIKDRITGEYRLAAEQPAAPAAAMADLRPVSGLARAIDEAPAPTKEVALRSAIAAAVEGRPVEVAPLFEAADTKKLSNVKQIPEGAVFREELRGVQSGQQDLTLSLVRDGRQIGRIDYAEYQGQPHIQMIAVPEEFRRQGLATALLQELQAKYPDQEINWGTLTEGGTALKKAVPVTEVADRGVQAKMARLETLRAKEADLTARFAGSTPTAEQRVALAKVTDEWNALNDQIAGRERELQGSQASRAIINAPITADAVAALQRARQGIPERLQSATDRATAPPLGRPGEPLPDREDAAGQQAAAETVARPEPKEPVAAIEAKVQEDMERLASTVAAATPEPAKAAPKAKSKTRTGAGAAMSLGQFLSKRGGVKDTEGELRHLGIGVGTRLSRLIRREGAHPDYAREAAVEAGYLPEGATLSDLYAALGEEAHGRPTYSGKDVGSVQDVAERKALLAEIDKMGEDATKWSDEQINDYLTAHAAADDLDYAQGVLDEEIDRHATDLIAGLEDDTLRNAAADEFDIPFEPVGQPPEGVGAAPRAGEPGGQGQAARPAGALPEGAGGSPAGGPAATEGDQGVIPGAERISDRALAERRMAEPLRGKAAPPPMTEGLFDVGGRGQRTISFERVGDPGDAKGSIRITEQPPTSPEIATLEAAAKAGQLPAADLAELKAADELIQNAEDLGRAYRAAADCPAVKGS